MSQKALVQLGRLGDLINMLPLVAEATRHGRRPSVVVADEFKGFLEGVSYCDERVFNGPYDDLEGGVSVARRFGEPLVSQVYGRRLDHRWITESYQRDSWAKIGGNDRWEQMPTVFDRRIQAREDQLATRIDWTRPVVLVNGNGRSSPFPRAEQVFKEVEKKVPEALFVNLQDFRATRFFDLLGLFDRASCLITVDTGSLHLAQASSVPVVALVNPNPWYGSLRRPNHLLKRTYREVDPDEIVEAVRRTMRPIRKIVHLYPEWEMSEADRARNRVAELSWKSEYGSNWEPAPVWYNKEIPRNSQTQLGDPRPVPFIKDVLEMGIRRTNHDDDLFVISNSDVGFSPGLTERLRRLVLAKGSAYCYRFDHPKIAKPLNYLETVSGDTCGGLDLFAFTRKWVQQHFSKLPDMVFGRTMWDLVYRDLVKKTGGGELYGGCWHEDHSSFWKAEKDNPGNTHNIAVAEEWRAKHDTTRPYRFEYVPSAG
jgi:hypothetical protein